MVLNDVCRATSLYYNTIELKNGTVPAYRLQWLSSVVMLGRQSAGSLAAR